MRQKLSKWILGFESKIILSTNQEQYLSFERSGDKKFKHLPENVDLWYQSNSIISLFLIKVTSKKFSLSRPISSVTSIVNWSLGCRELKWNWSKKQMPSWLCRRHIYNRRATEIASMLRLYFPIFTSLQRRKTMESS